MKKSRRASLGLVIAISAFAFCCNGGPEGKANGRQDLGTLSLPTRKPLKAGEPEKRFYLYGVRLYGDVSVTYASGRSYLNGLQWKPAPGVNALPRIKADSMPPLEGLSQAARKMFLKVPFVRAEHRRGRSVNDAASEFMRRMSKTTSRAGDVYAANISKGEAEAIRLACETIDTALAVADPDAQNRPRFGSNGSAQLYFHGFGSFGVTQIGPAEAAGWNRTSTTVSEVRSELRLIRQFLEVPAPVVILYGAGGLSIYTGKDGEKALVEIRAIEAFARTHPGKTIPTGTVKSLGVNAAKEILKAMSAKP